MFFPKPRQGRYNTSTIKKYGIPLKYGKTARSRRFSTLFGRSGWLCPPPEEHVRQVFILYLLNVNGFPLSHLSVEHAVTVNGMTQRYDLVVFDDALQPYMVVECKAPHVKLTQKVAEQASRYNSVLKAPLLCVTNGVEKKVFEIDFENGRIRELGD